MRILTAAEMPTMWGPKGHHIDHERVQADDSGFFYSHPEASCIVLEYPPKLEQLSFFARNLATIGRESCQFAGAVLWFSEWGVWNDADEGVGYRLVERLHSASGQPSAFELTPGHRFRADELTEAVGMLMQPMIFGWDAFFLPHFSWGVEEFFLFVSHDSYVTVVTRTREFYDQIFKDLRELNLKPKDHAFHKGRFCR